MVAKNPRIYLNPHGEMVKWLNGVMVKLWNGEITIDKRGYGGTTRKHITKNNKRSTHLSLHNFSQIWYHNIEF